MERLEGRRLTAQAISNIAATHNGSPVVVDENYQWQANAHSQALDGRAIPQALPGEGPGQYYRRMLREEEARRGAEARRPVPVRNPFTVEGAVWNQF